MSSFKSHLSLTIALIAILTTLQFFIAFSKIVQNYENYVAHDYAIIVITKKPIELDLLLKTNPLISSLELIDPSFVVDEIKSSVSEKNLQDLKANLPIFYRIKLIKFPSIADRELIEKDLLKINSIIKVESFAKNQNKIYRLLLLNKTIILVFAALMLLVAFLLIVRQMEVWRYQHIDRINIMTIFGASLWTRSSMLFKLAFTDSFISTLFVSGLFYYISSDIVVNNTLKELGLPVVEFFIVQDSVILFVVALLISFASVTYVISNAKVSDE